MEEKRKNKRLPIEVMVETERIDQGSTTTVKYVTVEITDISRTGIGFLCDQEFDEGAAFTANIKIWTKEVIQAIFKIVRKNQEGNRWHYGGTFIGMKDSDALRIQIYEIINDQKKE